MSTLDELRAFVAVCESGGFTSAGQRLGLTTNAVSLRIQRLEEHLALRLFQRTTRTVAPTEEGRAFYTRVKRILSDLEEAEDELRPVSNELRGGVRLALPVAIATAPFLERLRELLDRNPRLSIQTLVVRGVPDMVANGIDVGVVVGQLPETTFVGRLLGRAEWVLAAAPSYLEVHGRPRRPSDLASHRCLRLASARPQDEWILLDRRGREVVAPVRGGFEADDSRVLGDATYAGLGIGVRPLGECMRAAREGRLERVLPRHRFQPLDVYALLPKGRLRMPRIAACLEILQRAVEDLS